jgi:hypothetical protein
MTPVNYQRRAIDPRGSIDQAWELVKRRIWLYIGATLVMLLAQQLPYVGYFLVAPMTGGFAYIVLHDLKDEPIDFVMLFKGFEKFLPLVALTLIQAAPALLVVGIAYLAPTLGLFGNPFPATSDIMNQDPVTGAISYGISAGVVIWVIGYVAFSIIWGWALTFAIPLIIEHGVSIGDAIKLSFAAAFSNIGGLFVLGLWSGLVALLGVLALFVGLFVAMPVIQAAQVIAYRQVFPPLNDPRPDMPPPTESIYE